MPALPGGGFERNSGTFAQIVNSSTFIEKEVKKTRHPLTTAPRQHAGWYGLMSIRFESTSVDPPRHCRTSRTAPDRAWARQDRDGGRHARSTSGRAGYVADSRTGSGTAR